MFKTAEVSTMIESLDTRTLPANPSGRHPRPFRTFYYMSPNDKESDWSRISRACTRVSALKAAVGNMLQGKAYHVDIYDMDGVRVAYATRKGGKITLVCV